MVDQGHTDEIAPTEQDGKQLDYHHFSVVMHRQHRVAIFSACNVDYRAASRDERARDDFGKDQWMTDDRMAGSGVLRLCANGAAQNERGYDLA